MQLHHLALLSPDPERLAAFYGALLSLPEERRQSDAMGVRSVWFKLGETIWMIERGAVREGAIPVFDAEPGSAGEWTSRIVKAGGKLDGRTECTVYGLDPDDRRFGLSSFPRPLGPG